MTLHELVKQISSALEEASFDAPDVEARYFVADVAGMDDRDLMLHDFQEADAQTVSRAGDFLTRRLRHEPWQYILGHAPFRDLDLAVGPGCLIPRPETEYMLDFVMGKIPHGGSVCELGVGSGAVSLSIASERPDTWVTGVELSPDAMVWAKRNLARLGVKNVTFLAGDLFDPVPAGTRFDLIAANLPYIPEPMRAELPENVRDYEPEEALFAGIDGLDVIARAIKKIPQFLNPAGIMIFELDPCHAERAARLAEEAGLDDVRLIHDQYGVIRFLKARAQAV